MRISMILFSIFLFSKALFAEEKPSTKELEKISESMGHLIGKNLQELGLDLDLSLVVKGLQDARLGKASPLSENECISAISSLQEKTLKELGEKNLTEANLFLEKNKEKKGIQELEKGKLQYKVVKKGKGSTVEKHNSPILKYKGSYLDGTLFSASQEGSLISLEETIPGFHKGIVGMKEGEVRTIFIHPDLGYGNSHFPKPNALLTFEVELVKVDGTSEKVHPSEMTKEIAKEALR